MALRRGSSQRSAASRRSPSPGSRQGGQRRVSPPSRRSSASLALACASNRWQSPELAGSPIDKPLPRGYARAVTRTESGLYAGKNPRKYVLPGVFVSCTSGKLRRRNSNYYCCNLPSSEGSWEKSINGMWTAVDGPAPVTSATHGRR